MIHSKSIFCALACLACVSTSLAQSTTFTYQGRLESGGSAFTGNAEFRPTLWTAESSGALVANNNPGTVIVSVTNGLFVLPLDFGASFPGADRWLQLEVRTVIGAFSMLSPRQALSPTPYAITAGSLSGSLPATQITGTLGSASLAGNYSSVVALTNAGNTLAGNGADLTTLNASQLTTGTVADARIAASVARTNQVWLLIGNAGTAPGTNFLGTTDNQALEIRVNSQRALRIEPTTDTNTVNLIGGSSGNTVIAGVVGATIGGGGAGYYEYEIHTNRVDGDFGTIAGGSDNVAGPTATVGGGYKNQALGLGSFVGGGGHLHRLGYSVGNTAYGSFSVIGGGHANKTRASLSTIGGGSSNDIQTNASNATIGGGGYNIIFSNAVYATIPGGRDNAATNYAFAAGNRAKANHTGSFVWGDSASANIASTNANSVTFRAGGGYRLFSTTNAITGVFLAAGGGSWTSMSDRNSKENFTPVDPLAVLEKVTALPLSTWNYKAQDTAVRHIGPMAQDFKSAFAVGESDTGITTLDADGVALAAIQGLNRKLETENAELKREIDELKAAVRQLVNRAGN